MNYLAAGHITQQLYQACGLVIDSDLPLDSLLPAAGGEASIVVRQSRDEIPQGNDLVYELKNRAGGVSYQLERREDGSYVWAYPTGERFAIAAGGRGIAWSSPPDLRSDTAGAICGPILGLAMQLQGVTALHGSALVIDDAAVAVVAPAGYGKSTTASALLARGCALLSDDFVALLPRGDAVYAQPSYPRMKLWPDSLDHQMGPESWRNLPRYVTGQEKRVFHASRLGDVCTQPKPLKAIFALRPQPANVQPEARRLTGTAVLVTLLANGYNSQLLTRETSLLAAQLSVFQALAKCTAVFELLVPRDLNRLDEVIDTLFAALAEIEG